MDAYRIVIGNKAYSSWSLRPWLALRHVGVPFEEEVIPLYADGSKQRILAHAPSGKVPALRHGEVTVWDSLAICEYLAERHPTAGLWPWDPAARALARSVSAEMHSGFQDLRRNLFMDLKRTIDASERRAAAAADIARVQAIWRDCRARYGEDGPFLFGRFSIADCMYAPVCTRFTTWGVEVDADARAYMDAVFALPAMRDWIAAAKDEPWTIDWLGR